LAVARPIPLLPPVMTATFPFRDAIILQLLCRSVSNPIDMLTTI
jgi:hypothetical protein